MNNGRIHLFQEFTLDLARGCVMHSGQEIHLRPQTYEVLKYLVENKGHLISKDTLIKEIWQGRAVTDSSLGKCIEEVRQALGPEAHNYFRNVRGRGYIFDPVVGNTVKNPRLQTEYLDVVRVLVDEEEILDEISSDTAAERSAVLAPQLTSESMPITKKSWLVIGAMLLISITVVVGYKSAVNRSNAAPIKSIAVLPLRNDSGNSDLEYLSDGVTESLINRLSQLPGTKVIASSSSFKYKGKEIDAPQVASALGVDAILTGRVSQRGENLLINAELIDARDGTQIWGEQYNRTVADLQALQNDLARTIAEKLRSRLSGRQELQLTKRATKNSQAYQFYLNGLFHLRKRSRDDVRKALDYYNRAVTLDPDFAVAWVGVSNANDYLAGNSWVDPKEANAVSKAAAQRALDLDETLPEAHLALAGIKLNEWDWAGAEHEYLRSLELNPNLAEAHMKYTRYLSTMGRHQEALREIQRAVELDPLESFPRSMQAWTLVLAWRLDEGIEKYQQLIKSEPTFGRYFGLGFAYENKGMHAQAVEQFQKGISILGETTGGLCYLGYNLAMSGRRAEAEAILQRLKKTKEYVSPEELAGLYAALGDKEGALSSLERAYAEHDLQMQVLKIDWRLHTLHSDPRFQNLLQRMKFP